MGLDSAPAVPAIAPPDPAEVMAKAGRENFPVASRLLPRATRAHLLAVYGFARLVDDAADEASGDRLALLDWLEEDLDRAYAGDARHPLMRGLTPTVRACAIPPDPFRRLIGAGRQDQRVSSYETIDQLMAYCELSANPVGHLVLHVFGAATPERIRLSDAVCSGLQLTEHWQDVREDVERGRVYLPAADMARFGCGPEDLRAPSAGPEVRALMAFEVGRARELLQRGAPLVRTLRGRSALAVALFVAGGRAALTAMERAGYDALRGPPRASNLTRMLALMTTLTGKGGS